MDHLTCEISGEEDIAADMGGSLTLVRPVKVDLLLFTLHCVAQLTKSNQNLMTVGNSMHWS